MGRMKQHLNLLPWKYQRKTLLRKRLRTWMVGWIAIVAVSGLMYGSLWFKVAAARRDLGEAQRSAASAQAIDEQNAKLNRDVARLQDDIAKFGHLKNERLGIHLMAVVSQSWSRCGGKIQVQKMSFRETQVVEASSKPAVPPVPGTAAKPQPTVKVQALSITGVAANNLAVSHFVSALRDSGSFLRVDLKSSKGKQDRETGSHVYQVECTF